MSAHQLLEELSATFAELRASGCRAYPAEVWQRAISLTNQIPEREVCRAIKVQSAWFRKKTRDFGAATVKRPDFVELKTERIAPSDLITIDLETPAGFKARIQGSSFCLCQVLASLFREAR